MATLSAWLFDTPDGAAQAETLLLDLQKQQILVVQDAATVSWPEGAKKPKTKELTSTGWVGASMGGMWGLLFGLLFFVPLLGSRDRRRHRRAHGALLPTTVSTRTSSIR